ncbi:zinc finger protein 227 [Anabrus simplex]|uniref:zinc finger protein 227 n=1 Tax=Anabrus simplex TaxID=316456 RepID=UPI0035A33B81
MDTRLLQPRQRDHPVPFSYLSQKHMKMEEMTHVKCEQVWLNESELEDGISEKHEPIPQVWVKQEIKQELHDPSQATDEQKLQADNMPYSSDESMAESENVENGGEGIGEEETELQDIKSVCVTVQEQETSASDAQEPRETTGMKYCCRQNMILGKNCNVCKKPNDIQNKIYKCDICDKGFAKKYLLRTHMTVHGDKNFQCDLCLKIFLYPGNLNKHKHIVHSSERKFLCTICGKGFKTRHEQQRHSAGHSGKSDYVCTVCNKFFMSRYNLATHLGTHTGDKRFQCNVCSKRFSQRTGLVHHERLHTGEKPYKCDFCVKEFYHKISLVNHQRYHTGEKPYKCDLCEKKFYRRPQLVRHLSEHPK